MLDFFRPNVYLGEILLKHSERCSSTRTREDELGGSWEKSRSATDTVAFGDSRYHAAFLVDEQTPTVPE